MNFITRLLCKHARLEFVRNIYGDEINLNGKRSVWRCACCEKVIYKDKLHAGAHQ